MDSATMLGVLRGIIEGAWQMTERDGSKVLFHCRDPRKSKAERLAENLVERGV